MYDRIVTDEIISEKKGIILLAIISACALFGVLTWAQITKVDYSRPVKVETEEVSLGNCLSTVSLSYVFAENDSDEDLSTGTAVYVSGYDEEDSRILVKEAEATDTKVQVIGVVDYTIKPHDTGEILIFNNYCYD